MGVLNGWEHTAVDAALSDRAGCIMEGCGAQAALVGDFCCLAGRPDGELIARAARHHGPGELILTLREPPWHPFVADALGPFVRPALRYAFHREAAFDRDRLRALSSALPGGIRLQRVDRALYDRLTAREWSRDLVGLFDGWEDFSRRGMAVVALSGDEPVAGAGSYYRWSGGWELQVDAREDHRRRGLAAACSAAFILQALEQGLVPSWDAANAASAALARKLGYRPAGPYPVWLLDCAALLRGR